MKPITKRILLTLGVIMAIALLATTRFIRFANVKEDRLPRFIEANVVNPSLVNSISKFRSGAGHSNPGWPEQCRSMKHYITVYDPTKSVEEQFNRSELPPSQYAIDIYSPVNGRLSMNSTGEGDDQVNIGVDNQPGFSVRFEHVHLLPTIGRFNAHVTAGQKIATVWNTQNFDLSIFYHYFRGTELFSYFEVLPDNLFAAWQSEGATSPDQFIFTKAYRDAHPLHCLNDRRGTPSFADSEGRPTENWVPENFVQLKPDFHLSQDINQSNNINNSECQADIPTAERPPGCKEQ